MAGSTIAWKNSSASSRSRDSAARFGGWDEMHDFFWGYTGGSATQLRARRPRDRARPRAGSSTSSTRSGWRRRATTTGPRCARTCSWRAPTPSPSTGTRRSTSCDPSSPTSPNDSSAARAGIFRSATRVNQNSAQAAWPGGYPYIQLLDSCDGAVASAAEKNQMNAYVVGGRPAGALDLERFGQRGQHGDGVGGVHGHAFGPGHGHVSVAWATVDGKARPPAATTRRASGTVTFSAGTTTQPIAIAVAGDLLDEDERGSST